MGRCVPGASCVSGPMQGHLAYTRSSFCNRMFSRTLTGFSGYLAELSKLQGNRCQAICAEPVLPPSPITRLQATQEKVKKNNNRAAGGPGGELPPEGAARCAVRAAPEASLRARGAPTLFLLNAAPRCLPAEPFFPPWEGFLSPLLLPAPSDPRVNARLYGRTASLLLGVPRLGSGSPPAGSARAACSPGPPLAALLFLPIHRAPLGFGGGRERRGGVEKVESDCDSDHLPPEVWQMAKY